MFKSNNKAVMSKKTNSSGTDHPSLNMISDETIIKGSLETKNDVRISGKVEGNIQTGGKCIITQSGTIEGDIIANEADIAGKVAGEITIYNKLFIRKDARISGDINTSIINIEEGGVFDGSLHMSSEPKPNNNTKSKTDNQQKNSSVEKTA